MATAILEPREGGRWYEQGVDGSECDWGRVLAWEPPHRLVVTWQINGHWQYDPDPAQASEIEVRFTADGPDQTIVASNTAAWTGSSTARPSVTASPAAAAGLASWTSSPRQPPTRPDPATVRIHIRAIRWPGHEPASGSIALSGPAREAAGRSGSRGGIADAARLNLPGVDGALLLRLAGAG